jgi:hypothetical protein
MENQYLFMPKISLKPNGVTSYNEVLRRNSENGTLESLTKNRIPAIDWETGEEIKLTKQFHNFKISDAGRKKLQLKINWLFQLARSRYIETYNKKKIYNFKINFLTLTLPSTQIHNTAEITKSCFNQFLTEMKQRTKMENYVWRIEFQSNGNLHYHIVTDTYIDYFFAVRVWNRIINKLGYVDRYQEKMKTTKFSTYLEARLKHGRTRDEILKNYTEGMRTNWEKPPSINVKVCTSNKTIAFYIAKYFSKKSMSNPVHNVLDNKENSFSLRLWYSSQSLSKLDSLTEYAEEAEINWFEYLKGCPKVLHVVYDYCECLYFDIKDLYDDTVVLLRNTFKDYSIRRGYTPA